MALLLHRTIDFELKGSVAKIAGVIQRVHRSDDGGACKRLGQSPRQSGLFERLLLLAPGQVKPKASSLQAAQLLAALELADVDELPHEQHEFHLEVERLLVVRQLLCAVKSSKRGRGLQENDWLFGRHCIPKLACVVRIVAPDAVDVTHDHRRRTAMQADVHARDVCRERRRSSSRVTHERLHAVEVDSRNLDL